VTADARRVGASLDIRFDESIAAFADYLESQGLNHVEIRQGYVDVRAESVVESLRPVLAARDLSVTVHAPHIDCAMGNINERLRRAAVEGVKTSLDMAAAVDAGGVVVHGGATRQRYPEAVQSFSREQALASVEECARYAASVKMPLCLENSRETPEKCHHTATPERLAAFLADLDVETDYLRLTLDVGHANVTGIPYGEFVDRFGDRIQIVHLHDNDGTADDHDPLPDYETVVDDVGAPYNVLEMKALDDIRACVDG
jgi:sugar phosphate isomerase/epimerase